MDEITIMKAISHPFIVKILDDFMDSDGHLCIVNEFYDNGDFIKYLKEREGKPFSEREILNFLANIFLVVFHLNSRDIFHRDLKPGNFLMKREANGKTFLHLSDFGAAESILQQKISVCAQPIPHINTVKYRAPEILKYIKQKPNITKQNVWSIGVIAYELCTFSHPFKGETMFALLKSIIEDPPLPLEQDYSQELKDLIS